VAEILIGRLRSALADAAHAGPSLQKVDIFF
jgi:hypothetical protein